MCWPKPRGPAPTRLKTASASAIDQFLLHWLSREPFPLTYRNVVHVTTVGTIPPSCAGASQFRPQSDLPAVSSAGFCRCVCIKVPPTSVGQYISPDACLLTKTLTIRRSNSILWRLHSSPSLFCACNLNLLRDCFGESVPRSSPSASRDTAIPGSTSSSLTPIVQDRSTPSGL